MNLLQVFGISGQEEGDYILKDISFTQQPSQKIAIAGATGSGKTTLLKIIAGWVQPHSGEVFLEGIRVKGPEEKLIPGHSQIAYLSQHFELRNHYRVEELLGMANQLSSKEAGIIYSICRIDHLLNRWTHQLSGGEKQRIALARLLVSSPRLLLLDEPFSNLDVIHKNILKSVLHDISEELKITGLLVSHDPLDVLSWADEVLILQEGAIIQKGSPIAVYTQPVTDYAAGLLGRYSVMDLHLKEVFSEVLGTDVKKLNQFVRPEKFTISSDKSKGLKGEVKRAGFMGSYYELEIDISGTSIVVNNNNPYKKGDEVYVTLLL